MQRDSSTIQTLVQIINEPAQTCYPSRRKGQRNTSIYPLFSPQMPGKFGRPYQHSRLWIPSKLKNQILTSKMSHQLFLCLSLPESLGQRVAEAEKKIQESSWQFLNWKRKLLYWRKHPTPLYYSGSQVQEKSQTYWTTQQVPNSILSFNCFLASFLDRHATGSRLRL